MSVRCAPSTQQHTLVRYHTAVYSSSVVSIHLMGVRTSVPNAGTQLTMHEIGETLYFFAYYSSVDIRVSECILMHR